MVSTKLRMSSGFGKSVFIVEPSDSSERSGEVVPCQHAHIFPSPSVSMPPHPVRTSCPTKRENSFSKAITVYQGGIHTFLNSELRGRNLLLLPASCLALCILGLFLFFFLQAPGKIMGLVFMIQKMSQHARMRRHPYHRPYLQHLGWRLTARLRRGPKCVEGRCGLCYGLAQGTKAERQNPVTE
jgi:hypothetical protein